MVIVGRNQPCPCGSGRRYKECHGAIGAVAAAVAAAPAASVAPSWLPQAMRAALRAQRNGAGNEAARLYRHVLAADPSNFDATHMLGLVEYERGYLESALALIKHAIELRPDLGVPRHNLRLLESMPLVETEICREVLPRLVPRVDCGFDLAELAAASSVQIIIGDSIGAEERVALGLILEACGPAPVGLWGEAADAMVVGMPSIAMLAVDDHPRGGLLVLLGTARSPAIWLSAMRAERVLLIVTRDEPCTVIDRVDELAAVGHHRPGLLCATRALAERLRLPRAASLPEREVAACAES
ncbi:MAG: SEC-C metal-binding domain-containing protein [Pseudomonadota bacterium]|nr:SEC-C metal-binding domain-containing protein [Pseudomonadota bacterium]